MKSLSFAIALMCSCVFAVDAQQSPRTLPQDSTVAFDFVETDMKAVITAMAEAGGLNVIFTTLPPKQVTFRTSSPVPRRTVRALLKNIVETNGLQWVETDGLVRVIPAAPQEPAPPAFQRPQERPAAQEDSLRLYVYRIKHTQSHRLASTIQALFGIQGVQYSGGGLSRGTLSDQLRSQRIPPGFPQAAIPQQANPQQQGTQSLGPMQIVADESSNALLVRARPGDWQVIQEAIQLIDVRPLQVLIETMIVEVRSTDLFNLSLALDVPPQRDRQSGAIIEGTLGTVSAGDLVLRVLELGRVKADVIVSAISSKANVNVLSRPVILAQNNFEARILIGSQRPFIQVVRALPTESAVRDQIVQYQDVGTSLTILPTISDDGYVSMQMAQEVSNATSETQFGAPVISTREASTQLLVKDGQTAVIGGLIDQQRDRTRSGVPLLKNLPILGWLFGSTKESKIRTELFLFVTPHIIRTDEDAARYRDQMQQATELMRKNPQPSAMIPDTSRTR